MEGKDGSADRREGSIGLVEAHRRGLLETAASRAAGLPDGPDRRLGVAACPAGRDRQAAVYFTPRG